MGQDHAPAGGLLDVGLHGIGVKHFHHRVLGEVTLAYESLDMVAEQLQIAKDNGLSETELEEVIIHLAFYAGWPRAMSAIAVAKQVFAS